ncbi:MAG: LCP family protein [Bowdeniella nasicola]|nr:LCP family protein [Bowdeniella nasicola]
MTNRSFQSSRHRPRYSSENRFRPLAARGSSRRQKAVALLLALLLFASTAMLLAYIRLQGNIQVGENPSELIGERPDASPVPLDPNAGRPINLLVIGSDVRDGDWADEDIEGMRSDATLLLHISADRKRVDAVSIPRDTRMDIPQCLLRNGKQTAPGYQVKFNEAFFRGGIRNNIEEAAACTMKTVEGFTGIYIDDYVVVDFSGFQDMVNALDGVPLYVEEDIGDDRANLYLKRGCRLLDGQKALGYARARYTLGDGSDLSRIDRQQQLLSAIVREALQLNLLTDLTSLYQFLDAATQSLSTGPQLGSLSTLAGLGYSLRAINPSEIVFITMPVEYVGFEIYYSDEAEVLWENIRLDRPLGYREPDPDTTVTTESTPTPESSTTPGDDTPRTRGTPTPDPTENLDGATTAEEDKELPHCTRRNAK